MSKKDCMFQYAISHRWAKTEIPEDTDLITLDEAKALWNKYLPDFIRRRENNNGDPEMVIWVNCEDNASYRESLAYIDSSTLVQDGRVYEVKKTEIVV